MKHTGEILLATLWIIIAAILTGFLSYGLYKGHSVWKATNIFNYFDKCEAVDEQTFSYTFDATKIDSIETELTNDNVEVMPYNGNEILVEITSNMPEKYRAKAFAKGTTLCVESKELYNILNWNIYKNSVVIKLPYSFAANSNHLYEIKTVSGEISITDIAGNSLEVKSTSGNISVSKCRMVSSEMTTVSGEIKTESCEIKEVDVKSTSGEILVDCNSDDIEFGTISGNITFCANKMPVEKIEAESVSGSVSFKLPENNGYTFEYKTTSGSVKDDFLNFHAENSGRSSYKSGSCKVKAKTVSGSISILKN